MKPRLHFGHSYGCFCGPFKWLALKCSSRSHLVANFCEHFELTWGCSALSVCLLKIWRFRWPDCLKSCPQCLQTYGLSHSDMSISVGLLFECFATNSTHKWSLFFDELPCASRVPHGWHRNGDRMYTLCLQPWLMLILTTITENKCMLPDDLYHK